MNPPTPTPPVRPEAPPGGLPRNVPPIAAARSHPPVPRRSPAQQRALRNDIASFLCELIAFPSTPGQEQAAMEFLRRRFSALSCRVETVPLTDALRNDPEYSTPIDGLRYDGRFNLRITRPGRGDGRHLLLNTHVDVVPPSTDMEAPWHGCTREGKVYGRGACDAKGQIAAIYALFKNLDRIDARCRGDLTAHLVVEEENGGNGTLAMIREHPQADGCVVLEPSDGNLYTSIRGAVWFRLRLRGRAGHSGQAGTTRSALRMARRAMDILERFHDTQLAAARTVPLFESYADPMPVTFGTLHAGNWPASAPDEAVLEGVLGLLPNTHREAVCRAMSETLSREGGRELAGGFDLQFLYRHDSSVLDPDHVLPSGLRKAAQARGLELPVRGMTASCDAWFYNNLAGIPAVVYGPGSLAVAHSKHEHIALDAIETASAVLTGLALDYCGESS